MEGQKGNGLFAKGFKGWWWGACGAVGIGTETWAVLSSIPEGACACGAEGPMASIGPLALGAKGCVERLRPIGETTHYDLCVAGAPSNHVRCASLRSGGRRLAVRTAMEHPIGALPRTPFPASRDFPSRGNEKIGGTGYCVTYDTDSQSRNVLASPLGEEGHEVAKGVQANWIHRGAPRPANPVRRHPAKSVWTVVILIMILDVDVTAAGGIIKLIAR